MRAFFEKYHIGMKLLALFFAVILWALVLFTENPERSVPVMNIPVEIIGQTALQSNNDLVVSQISNKTVSIELTGSFTRLGEIDMSSITVRADVSHYSAPGEYMLSYDISTPDGVTITSRSPQRIPIVIEEIVEKELPVRVEYEGELDDGIHLGDATVEPSTVIVSGISSVMEKAEAALVMLDADALTEDFSAACEYVIVGADNKPIASDFTRFIDKTVQVDIPVFLEKAIPVNVNLMASAGVPKTSIVVQYEPEEIMVYGRASAVNEVRSLNLGQLDVRSFESTFDGDMPIVLPDGLEFAGDPVENVTVHISFRGVEIRQVSVTNILLENVPETLNVFLETTNIEVTVRGQKERMKDLDPENFRAVVDMAEMDLPVGRHLVPVTMKSSIGGYDIYGSYNVIVEVREPEPDTPDEPTGEQEE